jgi:hypothetical protein
MCIDKQISLLIGILNMVLHNHNEPSDYKIRKAQLNCHQDAAKQRTDNQVADRGHVAP